MSLATSQHHIDCAADVAAVAEVLLHQCGFHPCPAISFPALSLAKDCSHKAVHFLIEKELDADVHDAMRQNLDQSSSN